MLYEVPLLSIPDLQGEALLWQTAAAAAAGPSRSTAAVRRERPGLEEAEALDVQGLVEGEAGPERARPTAASGETQGLPGGHGRAVVEEAGHRGLGTGGDRHNLVDAVETGGIAVQLQLVHGPRGQILSREHPPLRPGRARRERQILGVPQDDAHKGSLGGRHVQYFSSIQHLARAAVERDIGPIRGDIRQPDVWAWRLPTLGRG
mmetsp:Transcript_66368/g.190819  ORF Transcript_66368/g.190819 Transcript_66368/m.190819 type:complete len:205 (-) Transcript_66368:1011-1625(-)